MSDVSFSPDPEELARQLDPANLQQDATTGLQRMVFIAEGAIKRRTPVRSGRLRRSVTGRVIETGKRGVVGTNLIYALPVHRRNPYMELGLADVEGQLQQEAAAIGAKFVGRVGS
jgi:hypothetical protein